jgi:1,4-dihydroxy-2-naphthoate octaprenyltransferase
MHDISIFLVLHKRFYKKMKHSIKEWIFATRPWSLTASSMPALAAMSYIFFIRNSIDIDINWFYGTIALIGAVVCQVGGNLLNDYFDYVYNVDRKDTYSSRTLVDNIFTKETIFIFGLISIVIGGIIGMFLLFNTGYHLAWIGILGILGAYFYNKLKYIAFGDIVIFAIYGLLIGLGVAWVMTNILMWQILLIVAPIGFLIVGILHANNTRDILNDKKAGIKTQAMILGVKGSKIYFTMLVLLSYLLVLVLVILKYQPYLSLSVFITLPISIKCIKQMNLASITSLENIKTLAEDVAKLVMIFSLVFTAANFIAGMPK